jgi:hypothetical protein
MTSGRYQDLPSAKGEVGVPGSSSSFVMVATYPDEATAREDYRVVTDAHALGLVGSYDAAVVTKDASGNMHENKDETAISAYPVVYLGLVSGPGRHR